MPRVGKPPITLVPGWKALSTTATTSADSFATTEHDHDASDITTGIFDPARLPTIGGSNTLSDPPVRPRAGRWYVGTSGGFATGKAVTTELTFHPISFSRDVTITQIGLYISGASASVTAVRLGIYNSREADGLPGTVALDAGTIDATTTGAKTITLDAPVTLNAGALYWTCHTANATGAGAYGATPTWDLGRSSVTSNGTHALLLVNSNGNGAALPEVTADPNIAPQGAFYAMPVLYVGSVA